MNENAAADLLEKENPALKEKIAVVFRLALPAILAQTAEIIMEYIDSSMVGRMGAQASAAIGLVAPTLWLAGGLISAWSYGFSVQAAQAIGGRNYPHAKAVYRQAVVCCLLFSLALTAVGLLLAPAVPGWLGSDDAVVAADAIRYFTVFVLSIPIRQLYFLSQSMLQCSGNMRTPSIVGILLCALDVVFNAFLIFPSFSLGPLTFPGAGLGVTGAALGTALSFAVCLLPLLYFSMVRSPLINLKEKGSWKPALPVFREACRIGIPMALEQAVLSLAQIFQMKIIAPLGTTSIAAHSFAVTAESFCYMPGYGIAGAATTMVGQACGAKKKELARSFAWICTLLGMILMSAAGLIMYYVCPYVFAFLTPVPEVQQLGARVLRIELHAEPLFAASIVATGALRGAGDTMIPFLINLFSMWGVRLTLSWYLVQQMGLAGAWTAMVVELSVRGILFLIRLARGRWLKHLDAY